MTDPDHQVIALLALAALIGTVIWALRWLGTRVDARLDEHRAAARCMPLPEFEATAHRWHGAPPVMAWSDEIEDQCRAVASEAELDRVERAANCRVYDWREEGL